MNRTFIYTFIAALLSSGLVYLFFNNQEQENLTKPPVKRHISYSLILVNSGPRVIPLAETWVDAPNKQAGTQRCQSLTADQPFQIISDNYNNQVLHFAFENLPPYGKIIINIEADVSMGATIPALSFKNLDSYLGNEQFIETSDSRLISQAKKLASENKLKTIENTFNFVSSTLQKSTYSKTAKGALYALLNKRGDCTEFMHLFIALCRINQIPARGVSGYIINRNQRLNPDELHDWSEIYFEGKWRIADPFYQVLFDKENQYLFMQIHKQQKGKKSFRRWRTNSTDLKIAMID